MIVKTTRYVTKEIKDAMETLFKETVIIVPSDVTKILISNEDGQYGIYGSISEIREEVDEEDLLFVEIARFNDIEYCWEYVSTVAEELGLSFKDLIFE